MAVVLAVSAILLVVVGVLAFRETVSPPARPDLERALARRDSPVPPTASPTDPLPAPPAPAAGGVAAPEATDDQAPPRPPARSGPITPHAGQQPRIAIVIDDLGRSVATVERLAAIGVPLTYAVLPFETRTPEVAAWLRDHGAEVLCHLPMEPAGGHDPGPGALYRSMSSGELVAATRRALDQVPVAVGANNHMGSGFSAEEPAMRAVLGVLAERGLYYLDSRTTPDTVGIRVAASLGMRAAERQVFLDNVREDEHIRAQFDLLLEEAVRRGDAVAIAHPYPETLRVLAAEAVAARARGFVFVPASALARGGPSHSGGGGVGE